MGITLCDKSIEEGNQVPKTPHAMIATQACVTGKVIPIHVYAEALQLRIGHTFLLQKAMS